MASTPAPGDNCVSNRSITGKNRSKATDKQILIEPMADARPQARKATLITRACSRPHSYLELLRLLQHTQTQDAPKLQSAVVTTGLTPRDCAPNRCSQPIRPPPAPTPTSTAHRRAQRNPAYTAPHSRSNQPAIGPPRPPHTPPPPMMTGTTAPPPSPTPTAPTAAPQRRPQRSDRRDHTRTKPPPSKEP
jgi:hypothetical protein